MSWQTFLIPLFGIGMLSACSTTDVSQYAQEKPVLDMQQYFNGTIDAWGMFQDRSGKVAKRFTVVILCSWKDGVGTLDEDFSYSDGTKQKRVWTLKKGENPLMLKIMQGGADWVFRCGFRVDDGGPVPGVHFEAR